MLCSVQTATKRCRAGARLLEAPDPPQTVLPAEMPAALQADLEEPDTAFPRAGLQFSSSVMSQTEDVFVHRPVRRDSERDGAFHWGESQGAEVGDKGSLSSSLYPTSPPPCSWQLEAAPRLKPHRVPVVGWPQTPTCPWNIPQLVQLSTASFPSTPEGSSESLSSLTRKEFQFIIVLQSLFKPKRAHKTLWTPCCWG